MEFKILTLNCWGLPIVSKHRLHRMHAIAEMLATSSYDVVCLQELWLNSDYELIRDKVSGSLPFSHYFYSGITGSGICIFSRHPILDSFYHNWAVNGYIHKINHGDWFGGKGVGLCRIKFNNYTINVYSAHLHAEYNRQCDEYLAHRMLQAFDTAQFIKMTSGGADVAVLAGDLNTEPGDLPHKLLLSVPGLVDAFNEAGNVPEDKVATNETLTNSYTPENIKAVSRGKRIDFVMYDPGSRLQIETKSYKLPLPEKIPGTSFSYSDHEAVAVTLLITENKSRKDQVDYQSLKAALEESVGICNQSLKSLKRQIYLYAFYTLVLLVLLIVTLTTSPAYGLTFIYHVLKVVITILMLYTLIMATLWNKMERHGVIAGKLCMSTLLKRSKN